MVSIINEIIDLITPNMHDTQERRATVQYALKGCPVLSQIDWGGAAITFTTHLVHRLIVYGEWEAGKPTIVMLLEAIRARRGQNHWPEFNRLIDEVHRSSGLEASQQQIQYQRRLRNNVEMLNELPIDSLYLSAVIIALLSSRTFKVPTEMRRFIGQDGITALETAIRRYSVEDLVIKNDVESLLHIITRHQEESGGGDRDFVVGVAIITRGLDLWGDFIRLGDLSLLAKIVTSYEQYNALSRQLTIYAKATRDKLEAITPIDDALPALRALDSLLNANKMNDQMRPSIIRSLPVPPAPYDTAAEFYSKLIGRKKILDKIEEWSRSTGSTLIIEGMGGIGKSSVAWHWFKRVATNHPSELGVEGYFWWRIYGESNLDEFVIHALSYATNKNLADVRELDAEDRREWLLRVLSEQPLLLVLDGVEMILRGYGQNDDSTSALTIDEPDVCIDARDNAFLARLAQSTKARVILNTRLAPSVYKNVGGRYKDGVTQIALGELDLDEAINLLKYMGVKTDEADHNTLVDFITNVVGLHPLALCICARRISESASKPGNFDNWYAIRGKKDLVGELEGKRENERITEIILRAIDRLSADEKSLLYQMSVRSFEVLDVDTIIAISPFASNVGASDHRKLDTALLRMESRFLVRKHVDAYSLHPLVKTIAHQHLTQFESWETNELVFEGLSRQAVQEDPATANSIRDIEKSIDSYKLLIKMEQFDHAGNYFLARLCYPLFRRICDYALIYDCLISFFREKPVELPRVTDHDLQSELAGLMIVTLVERTEFAEARDLATLKLARDIGAYNVASTAQALRLFAIATHNLNYPAHALRALAFKYLLSSAAEDADALAEYHITSLMLHKDLGNWEQVEASRKNVRINGNQEVAQNMLLFSEMELNWIEALVQRGDEINIVHLNKINDAMNASGNLTMYPKTLLLRGEIALRHGTLDEAARHFTAMREEARRRNSRLDELLANGGLARVNARQGDAKSVVQWIDRGVPNFDAADAYLQLGRIEDARNYVRLLENGNLHASDTLIRWWPLARAKRVIAEVDADLALPTVMFDDTTKLPYESELLEFILQLTADQPYLEMLK